MRVEASTNSEASARGYLGAVAGLDGMGPTRLRALLAVCPANEIWKHLDGGTINSVIHASGLDGSRVRQGDDHERPFEDQSAGSQALFPDRLLERWRAEVRSTAHSPEDMERRIAALDLFVLSDKELPDCLREGPDPPSILFSSTSTLVTARPRVAIVGTRKASEYGLRTARALGMDLAAIGIEVVSGLALGIDAAAHAGALDGSGGVASAHTRTPVVAVIGAGHDRPCPMRNRALARAVRSSGVIVSEVPPGIKSAPWRYPVRNRLIAGLSDIVVVVESASSGGSMSTVAEALARDRVVMAVPGAVGRRTAQGCHDLLRDGAEICTGADDVISVLGLLGFTPVPESSSTAGSAARNPHTGDVEGADVVLELLVDGPVTVDWLLARSSFDLGELSRSLAALESMGLVATDTGWVRRLA